MALFKPTWFKKTFQEITVPFLQENGIEVVLTDLDNTLIGWDEKEIDENLLAWVRSLKEAGIKIVLVSNNNEHRIKDAAEKLDVPYVYPGLKPLHKGFKAAKQLLDFDKAKTVMVGDQLLTDILGANTFGVRTIIVKPRKESDAWKTKINRFFEKGFFVVTQGVSYHKKWEED